ncbi:hypothetical protein [Leifsonia shinshuensis]|uniref:hypothetical protein n=1 Tax=Leifsonia shinshuensis TaxID=150026 RepID=UPI002859BD40|nr:hypothetical protein [Leifsonia shinshuensis]MDR6969756.1 membrane protein implicated in regulation of membrane protease activity [Leifsonia shinshuensis]
MIDRRDPRWSVRILLGLIWACGVLIVVTGILGWVRVSGSHQWAPALITTIFALIVLGSAVQLTVLWRRRRRQSKTESDVRSTDDE